MGKLLWCKMSKTLLVLFFDVLRFTNVLHLAFPVPSGFLHFSTLLPSGRFLITSYVEDTYVNVRQTGNSV